MVPYPAPKPAKVAETGAGEQIEIHSVSVGGLDYRILAGTSTPVGGSRRSETEEKVSEVHVSILMGVPV